MSNKNILFRADSSSTIGTGHIMRDLVLAKQYSKKGNKITFATQDLKGNINHKIIEAGYKIEILQSNNIKELNKLIKKLDIDLLVIDHYDIKYNQEKKLKVKNSSLKILSFDDTYEKHYCDVLLNHNISANKKRYKKLVPKSCKLKCGVKYTLIRDEFKKEKTKQREKKYDYLIALGGADTANLNKKVLKTLQKIDKNVHIAIITTTANKNLKKLKDYVKNRKNISLKINSNKVAKLINQSKLAIITPSVTANEVYYMQVPFIAIKTADNQKFMSDYLKDKQYLVLDNFTKDNCENR